MPCRCLKAVHLTPYSTAQRSELAPCSGFLANTFQSFLCKHGLMQLSCQGNAGKLHKTFCRVFLNLSTGHHPTAQAHPAARFQPRKFPTEAISCSLGIDNPLIPFQQSPPFHCISYQELSRSPKYDPCLWGLRQTIHFILSHFDLSTTFLSSLLE